MRGSRENAMGALTNADPRARGLLGSYIMACEVASNLVLLTLSDDALKREVKAVNRPFPLGFWRFFLI